MIGLAERAQKRLEARRVEKPEPVSLSLGIPLLGYAADESREELVDLWARLLAAAMDPARSGRVRQTFIAVVKAMDPVDALVLRSMPNFPKADVGTGAHYLSQQLGVSANEAEISLHRLDELQCIRDRHARPGAVILSIERPILTAFGTELLAVLQD